ncbi:SRPBCC family protein [Erythrobacteraceae bacterium E2-1 Yellow Sea]|nr:SRPBCC family protein [Erythrobacteraceae bacterium E2-1 Yellow Sea]
MKTFDVQSIGIDRPAQEVFEYVANPANLPNWTNAFKSADDEKAELVTPAGAVPIALKTDAQPQAGTVDWFMTFPDGGIGSAYSRVTANGEDKAIYSFVLMAPPVALEALEGALNEQMAILAKELVGLKAVIEG